MDLQENIQNLNNNVDIAKMRVYNVRIRRGIIGNGWCLCGKDNMELINEGKTQLFLAAV